MRKLKVICDRCGCEIHNCCSYIIYPQLINIDTRDILPGQQPYAFEMDRDYCEECAKEAMDFLYRSVE